MAEQQGGRGANGSAAPAPLSGWAVASLVFSVLVCCPVLTMIGPLLGWKALQDMKTTPLRGRRLARAGIAIGVVTTAMGLGGYAWWNVNVRGPMLYGPELALKRGFSGDIAGFKAALTGSARDQTDEDAARFLSELSRRYGTFQGCMQDATREATGTVGSGLTIPYVLQFDGGSVRARAQFVAWEPDQFGLVCRFSSIVIIDPDLGHLAYPADAISLAGDDDSASGDDAQEP